jgi:hypothetical protein
MKFTDFQSAYVETALWTSCDENGDTMDCYVASDIHPDTLKQMCKDCDDFVAYCQESNIELPLGDNKNGHDFWLTRNHHGAGFWDRGYENGNDLTKAAHIWGNFDLYVGDDGMIHGQ